MRHAIGINHKNQEKQLKIGPGSQVIQVWTGVIMNMFEKINENREFCQKTGINNEESWWNTIYNLRV